MLTTCQSFLVQPALGPAALMQASLPYHPPYAVKNQYSNEKTLFLPQMTEKDQAK